jgi:parvulin-like peptidyl-prolyl isomerase
MKKLVLGSLIAVSSVLASSNVLATVNGEKITKAEVNQLLKAQRVTYDQLPAQYKQKVLDDIISQALLIQKAEKSGIENTKEFKKELAKVKRQVALRLFLKQKLASIAVSNSEAKAFYEKNKDLMFKQPAQVKARHILVKTKQEADKIIAELRNTPKNELERKFIELAKTKSVGPSGKMGGELGWFTKDKMIPAFSEVAFKLHKGDITLKPVHTRFGWHVIYVEDKKAGGYVPFEKVKSMIIEQLKIKKLKKYVDSVKAKAKIKYYK